MQRTPMAIAFTGRPAVMLFFVLSGVVLSLAYHKGRGGYGGFCVRRVFRIYPAYLASMAAAFCGAALLHHARVPGLSEWFNNQWQEAPSAADVLGHASLIGVFSCGGYNNVVWSLTHEMRLSLMFPLIALPVAVWNWRVVLLGAVALSLAADGMQRVAELSPLRDSVLLTLHFAAMFYTGAILAKHRKALTQWVSTIGALPQAGLMLLGVLLFTAVSWWPASAILWRLPLLSDWTATVGSGVFIVLALGAEPLRRALQGPIVQHLGRISYSLYLLHLIVLQVMWSSFYGRSSTPLLILVTLSLDVLIASLAYYTIETPLTGLGRRLTRGLRPATVRADPYPSPHPS
jgi:peptidoglycan/LPS O-acetylase OafA/YrhL